MIKKHPLATFFALTFILSWSCFVPLAVKGSDLSPVTVTVVIMAGGFGPLFSALFVGIATRRLDGVREIREGILRLRVGLFPYLCALLLPPVLAAAAYALSLLAGGARLTPASLPPFYLYLPSMLFVFFLGGGQEEPGWRGFALPRLQARFTALWSSIILGLIWALWHLPLFFVPFSAQSRLPYAWYVPHTVALAIIFTWLFNNSKGSVFIAMLLHAGLNAATGWLPVASDTGALPQVGVLAIVEWAVALFLIARYGAANLSRGGRITVGD